MNKIFVLIVAVLLFIVGIQVYAFQLFKKENKIMQGKKILIAYYSYSGNTETIAKKIQSQIGGDLFKIETKAPYPKEYNAVVAQAKEEKAKDFRPELVNYDANIQDYDVIFLGTPVWWYTMSPALKSFIAKNNFEGKTIVPFCTHGGGGASSTFDDIKALAVGADIKKGLVIYDNGGIQADKEIKAFLGQL